MTPTTAIQRAEQWRKENACGEAAKVAIALLNELQALQASRAIPEGHVVVPKFELNREKLMYEAADIMNTDEQIDEFVEDFEPAKSRRDRELIRDAIAGYLSFYRDWSPKVDAQPNESKS